MSNNKERKEVASRLRVLASHKAADEELTLDALGLYRGENIEGFDTCCVMNLADLIEPEQERTCFKVIPNEMEGYVFCSKCGAEIGEYGVPNYCHNCVARVVSKVISEFDCDYHCNECGQITRSKCPIFKKVIE